MVQCKIVSLLLVYVYVNSVTCGRQSYNPSDDGLRQSVHSLKKRAPFLLKPLKHVIGHIADHLDIHHHRGHDYCDFKHFPHHHDFPQNPHHGHEFRKDFNNKHEPGWFHRLPPRPPTVNSPGMGFHHFGPPPDIHVNLPSFPATENHGFRKDKPDQNPKTEGTTKQDTENQATTSPNIKPVELDKDYPVNDFEKNKENNGKNPFQDGNDTVNLESDFSGDVNEGKNIGKDPSGWVIGAEDDIDDTENGKIPFTSQIDIRFSKN